MSGFLRNSVNRCVLSFRSFTKNAVRYEKSPAKAAAEAEAPATQAGKLSGRTHRVNNLEKRFLVWTKKYKTVDEIPAYLAPETVEKARNRIRIRLANIMMLMTAVACMGMIMSGKKAAERGESVQKANIEWHRRVNEEEAKKAEVEAS